MRVSPSRIDPLSWVTHSSITIAIGIGALAFGLTTTVFSWAGSKQPYLDLEATFAIAGACILVWVLTQPLRPPLNWRRASMPLALAIAGLALSALASSTSTLPVQLWWAPLGVSFVLASLAPFSSARALLCYGTLLTVAVGVAAHFAFAATAQDWSDASIVTIAIATPIQATVLCSAFSYLVVRKTQKLLAGAGEPIAQSDADRERAAEGAHVSTIARLGSRVAPFLKGVADAGEVTTSDRALAGQLARRLRSELVTQTNRTWLDSIAEGKRLYVVDPERRADKMTGPQRTVLRGLILSVIDDPAIDDGSLLIEFRGHEDGSTAVALSLSLDLPEGRRAMLLAPYYLALETAVTEISWDPVLEVLRFRVPPRDAR